MDDVEEVKKRLAKERAAEADAKLAAAKANERLPAQVTKRVDVDTHQVGTLSDTSPNASTDARTGTYRGPHKRGTVEQTEADIQAEEEVANKLALEQATEADSKAQILAAERFDAGREKQRRITAAEQMEKAAEKEKIAPEVPVRGTSPFKEGVSRQTQAEQAAGRAVLERRNGVED